MRTNHNKHKIKDSVFRSLGTISLFIVLILAYLCFNMFKLYHYEKELGDRLYQIDLNLERLDDRLHKDEIALKYWLRSSSLEDIKDIKDKEIISILNEISKLATENEKKKLSALIQSINKLLWRKSVLIDMALLNQQFSNRDKIVSNIIRLSNDAEKNIEFFSVKNKGNIITHSIYIPLKRSEQALLTFLYTNKEQAYLNFLYNLKKLKDIQKKIYVFKNQKAVNNSVNKFIAYSEAFLKWIKTKEPDNLSNTLKLIYKPVSNQVQINLHSFNKSIQASIEHNNDSMKTLLNLSFMFSAFSILIFILFSFYYSNRLLKYLLHPIENLTSAIKSYAKGDKFNIKIKNTYFTELETLENEFIYMAKTNKKHIADLIFYAKEQENLINYDSTTGLYHYNYFKSIFNKKTFKLDLLADDYLLIYLKILKYDDLCSIFGEESTQSSIINLAHYFKKNDKYLVSIIGNASFLILINLPKKQSINIRLKQFQKELEDLFSSQGLDLFIGYSIGAIQFSKHREDLDLLLQYCRFASLHKNKNTSDNFALFDLKIEESFKREQILRKEIGNAVEKNQLFILYQPQYSTVDDDVVGCEALLRWNHPVLGTIYPDEFIPIAEKTGEIIKLSNFIHLKALDDYKKFFEVTNTKKPFKLAINASIIELTQADYSDSLLMKLHKHNISPSNIEIEITETIFTSFSHLITHTTNILRKNGIKIAVDDFGTGASSLERVLSINIDLLKIDKCFIPQNTIPGKKIKLLESIIKLAKNINLKTLAEGVETKEQYEKLKLLGCDYIQGYLYSRPVTPEKIKKLLSRAK